jgi:hypothetical protein
VLVPLMVDTAVGRSDMETPARPQRFWMAGAISDVVSTRFAMFDMEWMDG